MDDESFAQVYAHRKGRIVGGAEMRRPRASEQPGHPFRDRLDRLDPRTRPITT